MLVIGGGRGTRQDTPAGATYVKLDIAQRVEELAGHVQISVGDCLPGEPVLVGDKLASRIAVDCQTFQRLV